MSEHEAMREFRKLQRQLRRKRLVANLLLGAAIIGALLLVAWPVLVRGQELRVEAETYRTPVENGRFMYWFVLPNVQPMPTAIIGLWGERRGTFTLRLDPCVRLRSIRRFAATDIGQTFEGDLIVMTPSGRHLAQTSPHKERPFENFNGWFDTRSVEYVVPPEDPTLLLRWVCRVTGPKYDNMTLLPLSLDPARAETRCHFSVEIDAEQPRCP